MIEENVIKSAKMNKNIKIEFNSKKLIDNYADMIYYIAIGYLEHTEDAEDVLQEVLMKYISYVKSGKKFNDDEHEKSWLIRVTTNICCNEINSARKRKTLPLVECIEMNSETDMENNLREAINKLNSKYRVVFELFYLDEFKISEISKILGISEVNVKTRLKRARDKVKEYIKKGEEFDEKI